VTTATIDTIAIILGSMYTTMIVTFKNNRILITAALRQISTTQYEEAIRLCWKRFGTQIE